VLLLVLTGLALYVVSAEGEALSWSHWWVPVFPLLAALTAYRLFRPRVPLALDEQGVAVAGGTALIGLRTRIEWRAIKRLRVTAAGLLLIELRDSDRWSADKPWLVRANMRTNERKFKAAVVQPLRELQGTAQEIVTRLQSAAPVRVDAPQGLKGRT
jgi:hypothetical protein